MDRPVIPSEERTTPPNPSLPPDESPPKQLAPCEQFALFVRTVYKPSELAEIRVLPRGTSLFKSPEQLILQYDSLKIANESGQNIYIGAMPRDHEGDKKDDDISHGHAAWADFDHITREVVVERFRQHGLPPPTMLVHSGNGIHVWWRFTTAILAQELSALVRDLADMLDSDKKVYNRSRIMRAPGFKNVKDPANHKPCYILEVRPGALDFNVFRALVPVIDRNRKAPSVAVPHKLERIPEGQRNNTLTSLAGTLRRRGLETDEILSLLFSINDGRCNPPLGEAEVRAIAISVGKYESAIPLAVAVDQDRYPLNEIGDGRRLADACRNDSRYCPGFKVWLCFNGIRWSKEDGEMERRAKSVALSLKDLADAVEEKELKKEILRHYKSSTRGAIVREMMRLAESEPGMSINADQLDRNLMLFNTKSGTIDLETGNLRPHDREDFITKISPVVYDENAECPLWINFLNEIMGGDEELVEYLQYVIGYCLTGDTGERVFFIFFGTGANGKSTLVETLRLIFGDYAARSHISTFMVKRAENGPSNDIARLQGKRLVTASESEKGQRLSESRVKDITGNEVIPARFLYQEHFEFRPEFKIILSSNYKPVVADSDPAIWSRIRLIPFNVSIPEEKRDHKLGEKLLKEAPGILRWAVEGCLKWQAHGLPSPKAVREATGVYRDESDLVRKFLSECCELLPSNRTPLSDLFADFLRWAEDSEVTPVGKKDLGERLKKMGYHQTKSGDTRYWLGIGLGHADTP